ncbi:MAG: cyclic nucleotide-binding domain-containing protein [Deltaproteobacteria bacterium]|nr:cyclic nucleotide-binding domain-containing protein [Deltaproteobacteria bacterium]
MDAKKEILRHTPIFGGLLGEELERVAALLREHAYRAGDVIVSEGEPGREMYIVRSGKVVVERGGQNGAAPLLLATLSGGDFFGEMAVIDIQPRSATVRAIEETATFSLSNRDLHQLSHRELKTFTLIVMNIAREISRRLRQTDAALVESNLAEKLRSSRPIL